jgi:hypothetical protein
MYILTFICRVGGWVFNFFCVCESHRISLPTAKGGGGARRPAISTAHARRWPGVLTHTQILFFFQAGSQVAFSMHIKTRVFQYD